MVDTVTNPVPIPSDVEVSGKVKATKFIGPLEGNADTATTATTASKLGSSNVGATLKIMYLNGGSPTNGTQLYNNKVKVAGSASTLVTTGTTALDLATTAQLTNGSVTKVGTGNVGGTLKIMYLNAGAPTNGTQLYNNKVTIDSTASTIVTTGTTALTLASKSYVDTAIAGIPTPMQFKGSVGTNGTIASLPAAAAGNTGYVYKAITAHAASTNPVYPAYKVGDTLISDGSAWTVIPSGDEPSGTVTSVATGTDLSGGTITTSGTIKHADITRTDTTSTASPAHSGTFTVVDSVTTNARGHVTAINVKTVTLPGSGNTDAKVQQKGITGAGEYPILLKYDTGTSDVTANYVNFAKPSGAVPTIAPSTGAISAPGGFKGPLTGSVTGNVTGDVTGNCSGSAGKLSNTSKIGDTNKPVYFTANGVPAAISYTIAKSVPSNAVFTDVSCTAVGNHYTPSGGSTTSASGGADTNITNLASGSGVNVVTGVTIDAAGHVTGVTSKALRSVNNTYSVPNNATSSAVTPSNAKSNGFWYCTSSTNSLSGADANPFYQYHTSNNDFRILTTAYNDSWIQQIGTDFRTNNIYFRRKENGTWKDWVCINPTISAAAGSHRCGHGH